MGDPAGIGPEICLRAMNNQDLLAQCTPVLFCDAGVLNRVADKTGIPAQFQETTVKEWNKNHTAAGPLVVDCGLIDAGSVVPGKVSPLCGKASYGYIKTAVKAARAGYVAGIATAPIHKVSLHMGGIKLPGHTEILAELTNTRSFCMMMASSELKVSLATTHTAISKVPELLSRERIFEVIKLTASALHSFGRNNPRIAVCGLNPHAGEEGLFGDEEARFIRPAIEDAIEAGLNVEGPMSSDVAFLTDHRRGIDAYVVMYHDQGLIPFKMLAFDEGVNITLGLPVIRSSVDHGTAFDIAWKGTASAGSMIQAVLWANRMADKA